MIVVAIPALLLAALSVAAFLGAWVWWLDLVANLRVQLALLLGVLGLLLVLARWRRTGWTVLVATALNAALVLPLFLGRPAPPPEGTPALRVVSYNVLSDNDRFGEVIDFLRATEADVVFLHEVSRPWEEAILDAGLPYIVDTVRGGDLIFGTLVLTQPGAEVTGFGFTRDQPRAVEVRLLLEGRPVALLSSHPLAPTTEVRSLYRDAQIRFAAEWAVSQEVPAIVAGDMNATQWSHAFGRLASIGGLRDSSRGFGPQPSFPTSLPRLLRVPIDHLVHSDEWVVVDRRLGADLGSDHLPLIVDLVLPS
ncbi:MAG: endonuclease/exonuclease/phosphatase family protein [Acidimicrobiia bacterium]